MVSDEKSQDSDESDNMEDSNVVPQTNLDGEERTLNQPSEPSTSSKVSSKGKQKLRTIPESSDYDLESEVPQDSPQRFSKRSNRPIKKPIPFSPSEYTRKKSLNPIPV